MRRYVAAVAAGALALGGVAVAAAGPAAAQTPSAQDSYNGLAPTPPMGFNDWNAYGCNVSEKLIEATALAMHTDGMQAAGYDYVNIDDCWLEHSRVNGHLVPDPTKFPDGIKGTADYVHSLGLKLGIYESAGTATCAGYPGSYGHEATDAQDFANWGVDYLKYDNCNAPAGTADTQQEYIDRYKRMSDALLATGRKIVYALCEWGRFSPWQWGPYQANLGRSTGDIRPTYSSMLSNFTINATHPPSPSAPRYFNDPDMLEIGTGNFSTLAAAAPAGSTNIKVNSISSAIVGGVVRIGTAAAGDLESAVVTAVGTAGATGTGLTLATPLKEDHPAGEQINKDGMTLTEERTEFSLWAEEAAPLLAGTDVANMAPQDLAIYENPDVVAVDQDSLGVQASVVSNANGQWVLNKPLSDGSHALVLFNSGSTPAVMSTSASALGLPGGSDYAVRDLWTHQTRETVGPISADVPAHGVAMFRVSTLNNPTTYPPLGVSNLTGLSTLGAGQPATATVSFTDYGDLAAKRVTLGLQVPAGWSVKATSPSSFAAVETGQTVQTTFQVVASPPNQLFRTDTVTGTTGYTWVGQTWVNLAVDRTVTDSPPVQAPYRTFSSATDAPAVFGQLGSQFGISGAGADLYSGSDAYSTIYLPGAVGTDSTVETEVASQQNMNGYAKAGILVRNTMTGSGTTPEGVILFESPSGGVELEWNNDGGTYIDAVTPPDGTIPETLPIWLRLVRSGSNYTGYFSPDNHNWLRVGSATVSGQADTQDAGMFVTSHATGSPGQVVFDGFDVSSGAQSPALATSYEAESSANTIAGGARLASCSGCSGGEKVGYVGSGGTLTFNGVAAPSSGSYWLTIYYADGDGRQAQLIVNGGAPQTLSFTPTGSFNTVGAMSVQVPLNAGTGNTIEFANPTAYAPDFDRILVAPAPS